MLTSFTSHKFPCVIFRLAQPRSPWQLKKFWPQREFEYITTDQSETTDSAGKLAGHCSTVTSFVVVVISLKCIQGPVPLFHDQVYEGFFIIHFPTVLLSIME